MLCSVPLDIVRYCTSGPVAARQEWQGGQCHSHLEHQALSQTACDVTRKAKRQNLFTFSGSIKYGVLIILMED
jgi:hypothetical protein